MKRAIIDLGTNTFNLLIGEVIDGKLEILRTDKEAVLLGMNGINRGIIAEEAWMRAIKTLMVFKAICVEEEVDDIIGFGTSALRDAKNGDLFIKEVLENTGIKIEIISGQRESELIYQGVKWLYDFNRTGMIMDIGGGSTEFILANSEGIIKGQSFDIGVSRLYQDLNKKNNFKPKDYQFIDGYLDARTHPFFDEYNSDVLIGASGSFETFYEMIFQKHFSNNYKTELLPLGPLLDQINWVLDSRYEDRVNHEWIVPMRKKMLPIAAYKIKWVIEKMNVQKVLLSPYSLKEGAFFEL